MSTNPRVSIKALFLPRSSVLSSTSISPLKTGIRVAITVGIIMQTIEGINKVLISIKAVTLSCIHNMVVVTSPIGDQAPPAFAAIIIIPANHIRRFVSFMIFRRMVIKTIVAVRLSIIADKIKAKIQTIHKSVDFFLVVIIVLNVWNPLK